MKSVTSCLIGIAISAAASNVAAQVLPPYVQAPTAALETQSELRGVAVSHTGRIVAVGSRHTAPNPFKTYNVVLENAGPGGNFVELPSPAPSQAVDNGHQLLNAVTFLPGSEDFIAVGYFGYDPGFNYNRGQLLHYRHDSGTFTVKEFQAPGYINAVFLDLALDPLNEDRILIAGTRYNQSACDSARTLLVEYSIDAQTFALLPVSTQGQLSSVIALPNGQFVAAGLISTGCSDTNPLLLKMQGQQLEVLPNPPALFPANSQQFLTDAVFVRNGPLAGKVVIAGSELSGPSLVQVPLAYSFDPITKTFANLHPLIPDPGDNDPNPPTPAKHQLFTVAAAPDGTIHAAGRSSFKDLATNGYYFNAALVQSYDGTAFRFHDTPAELAAPLNGSEAFGSAASATGEVFFVGNTYHDGNPTLVPGFNYRKTLILKTGPAFHALGPTPGLAGQENEFAAKGATPGDTVYFLAGSMPGSVVVNCPGSPAIGMTDFFFLGTATADAQGKAALSLHVPLSLSEVTFYFQAGALPLCSLSNTIAEKF